MSKSKAALQIINERFGKDTLISVATTQAERPSARIVNAYYEDLTDAVIYNQGIKYKVKFAEENAV